jgi:DNA-binding LacI/PurR family transcriptional regulator/biotin operon repressor
VSHIQIYSPLSVATNFHYFSLFFSTKILYQLSMNTLKIKSASEQLAHYLKAEIAQRTWSDTMPGETQLLRELGVGRDTIKAALSLLEQEGVIINQGPSRRRKIAELSSASAPSLRIGILCYDENDKADVVKQQLIFAFREEKHTAFIATETLHSLKGDVRRVSRFIERNKADAWVLSAASRTVTEWFLNEGIPAFAFYGAQSGISIAGVGADHNPAIISAVQKLIELGHRRIVSLSNRGRHSNALREAERTFLMQLESNGIQTSSYNLPSWEDRPNGFLQCLESLFEHTPPTALIIEEPTHVIAVLQFCGKYKLHIPEDVSLICSEYTPNFDFSNPAISHITWDTKPMIRRMVRWADNIASGKEDKRQTRIKAKFIEGGTIGLVQNGR